MEISDNINSRLVVKQAKVFLVLMLVLFALLNLLAAASFFLSPQFQLAAFLSFLLQLNALILIVLVTGELLLLGGLFWWDKIEYVKK